MGGGRTVDRGVDLSSVASGPFLSGAWLLDAVAWAATWALLRSMAPLLYGAFSRGSRFDVRVFACVQGCATLALALGTDCSMIHEAPHLMGGLVYFLSLCALVLRWAPAAAAAFSPGALFGLCAFFCMYVPCLVDFRPEANAIRLLGFELMFSFYSYIVETGSGYRLAPAEARFFLLVNPTLVVRQRGTPVGTPGVRPRGCLRIARGIAELCGAVMSAQFYVEVPEQQGALDLAFIFATHATALYLLHAGTASCQIGWLELLGWRVPERYIRPLLARDPGDFWLRWNTYLGAWLRRYLFTPLASSWRRKFRSAPVAGRTALGAAGVCTFVLCGVGHDLANYPAAFDLSIAWTLAFLVAGATVAVWLVFRTFAARIGLGGNGFRGLGYCCAIGQTLAFGWVMWSPTAGRMNPALARLLGLEGLGF